MRSTWPFVAGLIFAALVTLFTMPILVGVGFGMMALGNMGHESAGLSGGSSFFIRDENGRYITRLTNTTYNLLSVPMVGEPRPRRLLARMQIRVGEDGEGLASFDAWPMGAPSEFSKTPLYSIRAQAGAASVGEDSMFWAERGGRKTAYSLVDGNRLFDSDMPMAQFTFEPEARRMAALAIADEEFSARGGVAVISYAAPGRVLRRVVLVADDSFRANMLRATISATRLVSYLDEAAGGRVVELPLAAGPVRIPVNPTDMDLARAKLPAGLRLVTIQPWGGR
ncbi:hypothetical protein CU669_10280 [Paramagnetospirillum kuznetsovii]|uniref:Uncharacterized protein n=1 Tax=Paramagnetospirillum kuznetsovii TaxID=2053833 RepID=A0A364NYC3_9PROT|nr:hypothetical protein [Paramagnetospirillum kuznetsovii]RAU22066.1 hypothetical protein CU669_10280 [Paramagnetospirillum kuznetsovii]